VGEIYSFEDMHSKFIKYFSHQKRQVQSKTKIFNIRGRDSQNVKDFITRYNKERLQIKGYPVLFRVSE
jgi:predicted AAA+ superfamily ATPase